MLAVNGLMETLQKVNSQMVIIEKNIWKDRKGFNGIHKRDGQIGKCLEQFKESRRGERNGC